MRAPQRVAARRRHCVGPLHVSQPARQPGAGCLRRLQRGRLQLGHACRLVGQLSCPTSKTATALCNLLGITCAPASDHQGGKKAGAVEGFDPAALTQRATALAASAPARAAAAAAATAPRLAGVEGRIQGLLASAPLILFMKGSKQQPYCGFSSRVVDALKAAGHEFETFDILQDEEIRCAI